ncbi:DUF2357 domain-containing protein [Brevundimonas vesicularis]|uniref:DUF2357 domain-containing protein n=1 Tax=Brevundimonas vesicularis TaxID=41276 RepID=UPI0038D455D6
MTPALAIRDEASGAVWPVWPEAGAGPVLQETGRYVFELSDCPDAQDADLLIDGAALEALRSKTPGMARWRWTPGFHAGSVEAELRLPGRAGRRIEIVTDPDLRKLTRSDFDIMVREILEDTFALFSLSSFRIGVGRGTGARPPAIARLEFLRSRVEELEKVLADISRRPRRVLQAEDHILPYHQARGASGPEILKSLHTGRVLRETAGPSRLPAPLKGFLPARVRMRRRRSSMDISEHRQMAACLRSWASWLSAAANQLAKAARPQDPEDQAGRWASRCRGLARRLNVLTTAEPFRDAGAAPASLTLSPVFRNDPAYSRFFRLWQDMNLGITSVFGDFLNLPLARTYELYELWCFLRLLRASAGVFGDDALDLASLFVADAAGGVTLASGAVTLPVGEGWSLCFQRRYREFWIEPDGQGSYSRIMTPDIVLVRPAAAGGPAGRLIVLDAKYRIEDGLNDAISSIHTYRDALVQGVDGAESAVTAAYLLAPHVPRLLGDYKATPMPGRLFHPEYRGGFRFGAVSLRPGMTAEAMADALREMVRDAGVPA